MNNYPVHKINSQNADEKIGRFFYANSRYNPLFLGIAGIGFAVIYLLTQFNVLGSPSLQLLYISGALLLTAILQIPVVRLARNHKGVAASFVSVFSIFLLAILLTSLWEGILPLTIAISLITPIMVIQAGLPRKFYALLLLAVITGIAAILYVNVSPAFINRLQTPTPSAIAGLAFIGTTGILLVTVTVIARADTYRSLRTQLLTSFVIIVTIPAILATILASVGAYVNNESQILNVLETISKLKESQIDEVINIFKADASRIKQDPDFSNNIVSILNPIQVTPEELDFNREATRKILQQFQGAGGKKYSEIMVINIGGEVVVSTNRDREGASFRSQAFYQRGIIDSFVEFSRISSFNDGNLVFATPVFDQKITRGILVLRVQDSLIKGILEATPGFPEMETYLLREDLQPLTQTRTITQTVNTQATQALTSGGFADGRGLYENYAGDIVLGYYQRVESLNMIFISEVPREFVLRTSLNSLLGGGVLAIFAFFIAIIAVAVSADSIVGPISALAKTAESFAAGNLTERASIARHDEIGALGRAYDQMAEQLQDFIGQLEKRVADRTSELEDQSQRLLAAAEIAKEAASYTDPSKLLEEAGRLIQNRFGFYHTGIFLLDVTGEFARLVASPTEAGRQMIVNQHKLRVGEVGIVGRVAQTGEPRITLDTDLDALHFNNPLLPKTRSEMAIPIKAENRIIGVLDVQSDKPQAFAQEDVAIMTIFADQLGIAIERARLLQRVEANFAELERAYGRSSRDGWRALAESGVLSNAGYRFDNVRIQPISTAPELGAQAMQSGKLVVQNEDGNGQSKQTLVAIPVKLRGQSIGVVTVKLKEGYNQSTINTIEQAIERFASALESARLFEEARSRADREQAIAQVTSAISSTTEFESILRTTVEELGRSLGDSEVSIQITGDTRQTSTGAQE